MLDQTIDHTVEEDIVKTERFAKGPPPIETNDNDGDHPDDDGHEVPPVSNARLGMLIFLGAEMMFFGGLISAFFVFRFGHAIWPPLMQPRLPIEVTGANTAILLFSGYAMHRARRSVQNGNRPILIRWLIATTLLGATFLGIQGYEWLRLVRFGLTLSSGIYGSIFYGLIGCHAVHVFGAVVWLLIVLVTVRSKKFIVADISPSVISEELKLTYKIVAPDSKKSYIGLELCRMYWYFVVGLWPILYILVYLT